MNISLSRFVLMNLFSQDVFGSPVPRRLAHLHTQAESIVLTFYVIPSDFRGGVHLFFLNRHTPSGQSRVYRVIQLPTDDVHCRESPGTGAENVKVVPNGCCLGRSQFVCVVCCLFIYSGRQACGRTSWGHTGGRPHRISHPPSFCGA